MKSKFLFLVLPFFAFANATAQNEKVLQGSEITESTLIQALTPAPKAQEGGFLTRGIRVNPENTPRTMPDTAAKTASASLLITFQSNSAQLTPDAKQKLNIVGEALNSEQLNRYQFLIHGHADPSGNPMSNLKLSQRRAETVRQYLVRNKHVGGQRLEAIGIGDKEPLNLNNPAAPENRRVTIVTQVQ